MMEPRYTQKLYFNPDEHPEDTLKAEEFCQIFELRYEAQYPDPPKVSMDSAIQRWKVEHITAEAQDPTPNLEQYDVIREDWRSKDKVAKILGMFSSNRLYEDWKVAQPDEDIRKRAGWNTFVRDMKLFYKPTENPTLMHYHFRTLQQASDETFPAFCNRVVKEAKHCEFKCSHEDCTAENIAVRDQIIIGLKDNEIREEALKKSWNLQTLRTEGMKIESAARSGAEINGENTVNKMGKYSSRNINSSKKCSTSTETAKKMIVCFNCGHQISGSITKHKKQCPAKNAKCSNCGKNGHYASVCKSKKDVRTMDDEQQAEDKEEDDDNENYCINIFRLKKASVKPQLRSRSKSKNDFKVDVVINNALDTVIADTGARISVCGTVQAKKWGLLSKMLPSTKRIKPYKSTPIKVYGEARCAVTFGNSSVPVIWHIISGSCEPILDGKAALQLGIITFNAQEQTFQPVLMIETECKSELQEVLKKYPHNLTGLEKLINRQVKLHVDNAVKPVKSPPRVIPYHLRERADIIINEMIQQDVIEEHPSDEPAPWVSNCVLASKSDGNLCMTLDARNVNKAILSTNHPIPRPEDVKAKLAGKKIFSKLDFKSAFWQIELSPESRYITVFQANDKLLRYKRLTMGLKPSQGELNAALFPIFSHISNAHLIHDDVFIATATAEEHVKVINDVMEAISQAGLTLNPKKCHFGCKSVSFWGMIYDAEGVHPDPAKVEALDFITAPENKSELLSFLCMMQSNADFIPNFAQKASVLRDLTKGNVRFKWLDKHQKCFTELIAAFRKDALLRYFDLSKKTFIFTDAHITGFGAMLAQGESIKDAKPVAFASRTTHGAEPRYPQLDLEAMGVDFGLRRFRNYLVGSPNVNTVVTDHKPLCSIFNGNREGSIRTERIRMRHQDVQYHVVYQKGKLNQIDYVSRRGKPFNKLTLGEKKESSDLDNLLFMLHATPVTDKMDLKVIAKHTKNDTTLKQLSNIVLSGKQWIPKQAPQEVQRFKGILPELMVTPTGLVLKGERIVLPDSLQHIAIDLAHRRKSSKTSIYGKTAKVTFLLP